MGRAGKHAERSVGCITAGSTTGPVLLFKVRIYAGAVFGCLWVCKGREGAFYGLVVAAESGAGEQGGAIVI